MITPTDKITMLKSIYQFSLIAFTALTIVSCGGSEDVATEQPARVDMNSGPARLAQQNMDASLWYSTSAEAHYLYIQTYEIAKLKLRENLAENSQKKACVVLDIDETVLDNSPYMLELIAKGLTFSEETWANWVQEGVAAPLPGALGFTLFCAENDVEVVYVSNRSEEFLGATIRNLDELGFPFADEEHVMLMEGTSDKSERRARVASRYTILLYGGDNLRDYREDFVDRSVNYGKDRVDAFEREMLRTFVLFPNPMYGDWQRLFRRGDPGAEAAAKMDLINKEVFE